MKASTFTNSKGFFGTTSKDYLHMAKQWLFKTPDRALNQAYTAALAIKLIEDKYFNGNKIPNESNHHSDNVMDYLQADLEKHLSTAKLRLKEFKASRAILGTSSSVYLDKLGLIDEILNKYTFDIQASSTLVPPSPLVENDSVKAKIQANSSSLEVINVEHVSDEPSFLPKSIRKKISRFNKGLNSEAEVEVIKNFRTSKTKKATAIKFILVLVLVPLLTQQISKQFLISPIVNHMRGGNDTNIFLNSEMKELAVRELQSFEEELKFESLIHNSLELPAEAMEERVKQKASLIAQEFHKKSDSAISNVFADLIALVAFALIIFNSQKQIIILKSFMDDIVHGLNDSAKAFIIILFTDMFVGFHSPHGWEVVLEGIASHLGLPANRNLIFLFIATFPVILDAMFKFWVFRYLSMLSPSAVATYRNMNE
jgi:hypothetical protein